tara:strand:+ start:1266 stop:1451 length:186 start_codon:yes stop_codon:yes gene_type:complete
MTIDYKKVLGRVRGIVEREISTKDLEKPLENILNKIDDLEIEIDETVSGFLEQMSQEERSL